MSICGYAMEIPARSKSETRRKRMSLGTFNVEALAISIQKKSVNSSALAPKFWKTTNGSGVLSTRLCSDAASTSRRSTSRTSDP